MQKIGILNVDYSRLDLDDNILSKKIMNLFISSGWTVSSLPNIFLTTECNMELNSELMFEPSILAKYVKNNSFGY